LLALAARRSLQELREEAARRKAAATDPEEGHRRIHAERHVRSWTGADGAWNLGAKGTPEAGAAFMARLRAVADALFKGARAAGRREPPEAYLFDALMLLGTEQEPTTKVRSTGRTKVLIRVDLEAL